MAFKHVDAIEILLNDESVGALAQIPGRQSIYAFEYFPGWLQRGYSINPLHLPLTPGAKSFPGLAEDTWHGLPPAIADALPDKFGNSLINAKLASLGVTADEITPLDRLSYVADRAMGALAFRPAKALGAKREDILDIAELVTAARDALSGSVATDRESKHALQQLLSVGSSAGGARAKAVVNLDPVTQEITSGQHPAPGTESWLLKFDGVGADAALGDSQQYGRIEYAYSMMARDAGIDMPETRLLEENGRAHFMAKRFDRIDAGAADPATGAAGIGMPRKIHMQSLCAMDNVDFNLIHTNSYSSLFAVIRRLELGEATATEAFRRMAFNYMAMNCDDHSKNFSFLMDGRGTWRLAPAYDVTFAYNSQNIWLREHLMGVDGKFSDVTKKDLLDFASRHGVTYAKAALKDISGARVGWQDYARRAGLTKDAADSIEHNF
ncbi:MAG: type II toxin-antitoxin system HipA family toxin [Clostridiales Family XIII bacterium]|jgi:serine/threonine-protein kinase HipA|nr:type II toxin-antitoxin system HipA family toxin [Clostridiales Family XIII bacterium]